MSVPVVVTPEARIDIRTAERYLDQRSLGLGRRFVNDVLKTLTRLGGLPFGYGEVAPGVRAAVLKRFGYVVYYRTDGSSVEAFAVVHGSRDSSVWQDRI